MNFCGCISDALPGREALLVLDMFVSAALDQQVTDCVHVVSDGVMKWSITVLVLCLKIGSLLDQQVTDVIAAKLGRYREQSIIITICDVTCEHMALDVGLHDLDLIELDRVEYFVSFDLLDVLFVDFLLQYSLLLRLHPHHGVGIL